MIVVRYCARHGYVQMDAPAYDEAQMDSSRGEEGEAGENRCPALVNRHPFECAVTCDLTLGPALKVIGLEAT